ncbi:MAG: arylsulfotransferase family protein [Actinomycetota bacterium]|nr:arylsulfotransferase family protein [Actinomycetota bacterium]
MTGNAKIISAAVLVAVAVLAVAGTATIGGSEPDGRASARQADAVTSAGGPFRSRAGFNPPRAKVKVNRAKASQLKVFVGSKVSGAAIYRANGDLIWFRPCRCMDFRTQQFRGRPVLTWFEGPSKFTAVKRNTYMIANRNYRVIKRVQPGRGLSADSHEFNLTPRGTAFVTAYKSERRNLSFVGMGRNAPVSDSIAQEIDLRTGRVLWEWRSLDHVPVRHTYAEKLRRPGNPFDYFHINSINDTRDGNIIISGRSTNAIYKVSRRTGRIIWTLGGKHSDFKMGKGAYFSSQHDARELGGGRISLFDNGDSPVLNRPVRKESRGLVLKLNHRKKRAVVDQQFFNPAKPLAPQQANMQRLPNGNFFIGWGAVPLVSEHTPDGRLVFDAEFRGISSFYRSYRDRWSGKPKGKVAVFARQARSGRTKLWISWNGDSAVREWRVAAGRSARSLKNQGKWPRRGFESVINVPVSARFVKVAGLNGSGKRIGSSALIKVR